MSYALSAPLQAAVFAALSGDPVLGALVGNDIYNAVPSGMAPAVYVRLGSETVRDASDESGAGAVHRFAVSVITTNPGFSTAKAAAGAISDVLHNAQLTLSRGRLISLRFECAKAARIDAVSSRQIDLQFRARVQDT